MKLTNKYISEKENQEKPDAKKTVLSNESFAVVEAIEQLRGAIDLLRIKL